MKQRVVENNGLKQRVEITGYNHENTTGLKHNRLETQQVGNTTGGKHNRFRVKGAAKNA